MRGAPQRARPTGHGQPNGDAAYAHGSNVARPETDAGVQESLVAEQRQIGNNLAERRVRSAWSGKASGRDSVNATISMRWTFWSGPASSIVVLLGSSEHGDTLQMLCCALSRRAFGLHSHRKWIAAWG